MVSVTRDKKKYGAPTVFSEEERKKKLQAAREYELYLEIERQIERGRRDDYNGRINPLIGDDE